MFSRGAQCMLTSTQSPLSCFLVNLEGFVLVSQTQEWENLMRVVRELTESRSKLVSTKASLQVDLEPL